MGLSNKGNSYTDGYGTTHYEDGSTSYVDGYGTTHYSDGSTSYVDGYGTTHYSDGSTSYVDGYGTTHYSDGGSSYEDNYGTAHYSSGDSESGGCYLTTACVKAKNLPDDCDELTTLREFRDGYMKSQPDGEQDIKYYYKMAPKIVEAIDARDDAQVIWEKLYSELVEPCVQMIKEKRLEETYKKYKSTALELEREYVTLFKICSKILF